MSTRIEKSPNLPGLETPPVRLTIQLPHEVHTHLKRRSVDERRTKAQHIAWLIEEDVKRSEGALALRNLGGVEGS